MNKTTAISTALNTILAEAYRNGVRATVVEPEKAVIKNALDEIEKQIRDTHSLTMREYQAAAARTINADLPKREQLMNMAFGLAGEIGEVVDVLKKHLFQGHELDAGKLVDELGDVLWYVSGMAGIVGFGLDLVAQRNVDKLKARYPDGFSAERSRHRDEDMEAAGFEP